MNTHQSILDKTLALSFQLLSDWQQLPNFDLLLARQRQVDNSEVTDIAASLCRNYFRKKHYIDWLIGRKATKMPRGRIKKILGLVLAQLIDKQLERSIICDAAVRFCKQKYNKFEASFVNQFLRTITSEGLPDPPEDISLGLSPQLLKYWQKQFSAAQIKQLASYLKYPVKMTARRSLEKPDIDDLKPYITKVAIGDWGTGFEFYQITKPKEFLKRNNNRLYIQDPAPVMSINFLAPGEGEQIADLCAAPGGKSLLIAQLMNNKGQLYSCDISSERLKSVKDNLAGYDICEIRQMDATKPHLKPNSLDAVLVDVPCSNTGVIRRKTDVRWTFSESRLKALTKLQLDILLSASKLVKSGGRVVYSTCSICQEENLDVVNKFISKTENFKIVEHKTLLPDQNHDGSFSCKIVKMTASN